MAQQGQITKIYRLETIGYDTLHKQFTQLSSDLANVKKLIIELQGKKLSLSGNDLKQVNQQITDAGVLHDQLAAKVVKVNDAQKQSAGHYMKLNQLYREAKQNAQDLAAEFGVESEQAKKAAASAEMYKQQLVAINNLVKTGGVTKPQAVIESTSNIADVEKEIALLERKGQVVNELELEQAAAANEATQWAAANKVATDQTAEAVTQVDAIRTKYEQYTGSMMENIRVQLENNASIAANRAEQKQIEKAMLEAGGATAAQTQRLAELKAEELQIVEVNKALTVTIRNQAKELISVQGSLDQQQAQLNQLQQAYEQLGDAEKASPFGQELKKEIDILEPKVKALEYELGKFGRNVGNYPQQFKGAFKTLSDELDRVQGKLVKGNFSTAEIEKLTAQQSALQRMTKVLGQEFTSTSARAKAFKDVGQELAAVYGRDSQVFKSFSAQVAQGSEEIKKANVQLTKAETGGNKFAKSLGFVYGGLRKLANILPGLGISGILLLIPDLLQAASAAIAKVTSSTSKSTEDLKKYLQAVNNIREEATKNIGTDYARMELLRAKLNDLNIPQAERIKLAKQYNEVADASNQIDVKQINNLGLINSSITDQIGLIKRRALARASENIITQKAEALQLAEEKARQNNLKEVNQIVDEMQFGTTTQKFGGRIITAGVGADAQAMVKEIERRRILTDRIAKDPDVVKAKEEFNASLSAAIGLTSFDAIFEPKKSPEKKVDPLKNLFAEIDAERARLLAIENKRVNEIQKIRELTFEEEATHLKNLEKINVDALHKKEAVLNDEKKLNAEQKKDLAQFGEEISSIQLETSKKLNDIEKRRFDDQVKLLQSQLEHELKVITDNKKAVIENFESTELQKAEAQLLSDQAEISARERFYNALLQLNSEYNKEILQKAKDEIKGQYVIMEDQRKVLLAGLADSRKELEKELAKIDTVVNAQREAILSSNKNPTRKKSALDILDKESTKTRLATEVAQMKKDLDKYKKALDSKAITEKEYADFYDSYVNKLRQLNDILAASSKGITDLQSLLSNKLSKLFGFDEGSAQANLLAQTIGQGFDLAKTAMDDFYQYQVDDVNRERDLQLKRLDLQEQQLLARAQSTAEEESIQRQFAAKQEQINREAFEKNKKIQREQAKINLAIQLSNLAVIAFSPNPLNIATLGTAGAIMYAVQAAIALANYALNIKRINSAQYEFGGMPGEVPVNGGEFGGKPHSQGGTDFHFKGRKYNAEVKELAIVRTKDANKNKRFTVSGTQMQIASAANMIGGGKNFKPGARINRFDYGGNLGESLQAPIYAPAGAATYINDNTQLIEAVNDMGDKLERHIEETSKRVDRIKTYVVEKDITDTQNKNKKKSMIGTL